MVDVGCGIGGSSRAIARKYGAHTQGITLSPKQVTFICLNRKKGTSTALPTPIYCRHREQKNLHSSRGLGSSAHFE